MNKTFELKGNDEYQVTKTDETRVRKTFTLFPIWLNRFSWFQTIEIFERKYITRQLEFNDGFTYQFYWSKPKDEWIKEYIIR